MRVAVFHLDAFTTHRFAGNPAAVLAMEAYPDDSTLQAIAAEHNLAETAGSVEIASNSKAHVSSTLKAAPNSKVKKLGMPSHSA